MDRRSFWNEVSKYGVLLGISMGASKVFEQSLILGAGIGYAGWILLEWVLFAALFFAILYKATKKRALSLDPALGFSFIQALNYMILISILAAIPVACINYVYINSIVGYGNYVDSLIAVVVNAAESQPLDSSSADMIEMVIDQLRAQPQSTIFSMLFGTIVQYAFAGLFAGLILAGFVSRKPEIFKQQDEQ
ncbi:MAG: DUF4199 domain-containing protein [Rikenellaceae bacterium]